MIVILSSPLTPSLPHSLTPHSPTSFLGSVAWISQTVRSYEKQAKQLADNLDALQQRRAVLAKRSRDGAAAQISALALAKVLKMAW